MEAACKVGLHQRCMQVTSVKFEVFWAESRVKSQVFWPESQVKSQVFRFNFQVSRKSLIGFNRSNFTCRPCHVRHLFQSKMNINSKFEATC